ncbi:MAG: hydantoinase/oxoprolinase family protein [Pseudomonadota bacterium]
MTTTLGLDVGGAHLKAALVDGARVRAVHQFACPLWQGMDHLDAALAAMRSTLPAWSRAAVTMTGELSDLFPDRPTGVTTLVDRLDRELGPQAWFWMGRRGFGSAAEARASPADVGSTNFLATAVLVARLAPDALLVDLGSTTTDIIPVRSGTPTPRGLTDADRQATGELVYTGFTRTAVMAVASRAPFRGAWVGLAREHLATMADVRRILGELPDDVDLHATADGRGKSQAESLVRFARLLGRDAAEGSVAEWRIAAEHVREAQVRSIHDGVLQVLSASVLPEAAPIVAAGIGWRVVAALALRVGRDCQPLGTLIGADRNVAAPATYAAPAVAVALLADRE